MILPQPLQSNRLRLRTAEPEDAAFVLSLRLDPELSRFLKPVNPCLEKQQEWILSKKEELQDYHMIVESLKGEALGVIALYDIKADKSFDWGRWVISREAPFYVAYESMILLYDFAFGDLGLKEAYFEVQKENQKVIGFHKSYGATVNNIDGRYYWFSYLEEQFRKNRGMQNILKKTTINI